MRHDQQTRVYAAPEPVLGLVTSAANLEEARSHRTARVAMGFAAASAIGSAIVTAAIIVEVAGKIHHSKFDILFGFLLLLSPVSMLVGLILGIVARKTRTGRAAIFISLMPLGIMALFALSAFVFGITSGLRKA